MPKSKHRVKKNVIGTQVNAQEQLAKATQLVSPEGLRKRTRPFVPFLQLLEHVKNALTVPHRPVVVVPEHDRLLAVVAGSPSLEQTVEELRKLSNDVNCDICAVNGSFDWLRDRGINPRFHLIVDPQPKHARYVQRPSYDTQYLLASQCHPTVFEPLATHSVDLWHVNNQYEYPLLRNCGEPFSLIMCGSTAGLAAISVNWLRGYRNFAVFGMDGCVPAIGARGHVYENNLKEVLPFKVWDRQFFMTQWMIQQMYDYQNLLNIIKFDNGAPCNIKFYGDGVLSYVHDVLQYQKEYTLSRFVITEKTDVDITTGVPKKRQVVPGMHQMPTGENLRQFSLPQSQYTESPRR